MTNNFGSDHLWSSYQLNRPPKYLHVHQINDPLRFTTKYLFLRFSLFENIKSQAIYASGETPVVIDTTSFYRIVNTQTHSACFHMVIAEDASVALIKTCFVACEAPRYGVGQVEIEKRAITVIQCAISEFNDPDQHDIFRMLGGVQQVESMNSTGNTISSCALMACENSTMCTYRMIVTENNNSEEGMGYYAQQDVILYMCLFLNNHIKSPTGHGVLSLYNAPATISHCDFVGNTGSFVRNLYSTAVYKKCLVSGSSVPAGKNVTVDETVQSPNVEVTWAMGAENCHYQITKLVQPRQKHLAVLLTLALAKYFCSTENLN